MNALVELQRQRIRDVKPALWIENSKEDIVVLSEQIHQLHRSTAISNLIDLTPKTLLLHYLIWSDG